MTADNLDPKPWKWALCSDRFVRAQSLNGSKHATWFDPRPGFAQSREDYPA